MSISGDEFSDHADLVVYNNHAWRIGLTRVHKSIWFDEGWHEFVKYHSISMFTVLIFDKTACDIYHPSDIPTSDEESNHGKNSSSSNGAHPPLALKEAEGAKWKNNSRYHMMMVLVDDDNDDNISNTVPINVCCCHCEQTWEENMKVRYITGLNSFGGLKPLNSVTSLGLPVSTEQSFTKVVRSLRAPSKENGRSGGAFSSTCSAVAEIFKIAAIMNGLVLVGVAVGFVLLKIEASLEESE
ncbi:hypothetical protein K2173_012823 [Erythroxylum novogranatense]|uniref:Uncharacterized protein n=1 Tax=Erythroxylum novogranatense TaxID=1862640 RepID=A0AAV8S6C1_9ROSI|nr:hypothetical protein K2173_012823 [Erythroxylum novogranatense]